MLLFLTADRTWHMGYGAWSLFFAPKVVEGILSIALRFPYNLNPFQRYKEVIDYLNKHEAYQPTQRVFGDELRILLTASGPPTPFILSMFAVRPT